eukprot:3852546-Pyramimonas_sp.AAC.1
MPGVRALERHRARRGRGACPAPGEVAALGTHWGEGQNTIVDMNGPKHSHDHLDADHRDILKGARVAAASLGIARQTIEARGR